MNNAIPPITDPMGRHWDQPPADAILIDDTHAVMAAAHVRQLLSYDRTLPSGVYDRKMWRRQETERTERGVETRDLLCWYGPGATAGQCSINFRLLLEVA